MHVLKRKKNVWSVSVRLHKRKRFIVCRNTEAPIICSILLGPCRSSQPKATPLSDFFPLERLFHRPADFLGTVQKQSGEGGGGGGGSMRKRQNRNSDLSCTKAFPPTFPHPFPPLMANKKSCRSGWLTIMRIQPPLIVPRRSVRDVCRKDVCAPATEIPYRWREICLKSV